MPGHQRRMLPQAAPVLQVCTFWDARLISNIPQPRNRSGNSSGRSLLCRGAEQSNSNSSTRRKTSTSTSGYIRILAVVGYSFAQTNGGFTSTSWKSLAVGFGAGVISTGGYAIGLHGIGWLLWGISLGYIAYQAYESKKGS